MKTIYQYTGCLFTTAVVLLIFSVRLNAQTNAVKAEGISPFRYVDITGSNPAPPPPQPETFLDLTWSKAGDIAFPSGSFKVSERNLLEVEVLAKSSVALTDANFTTFLNGSSISGAKMRKVELRPTGMSANRYSFLYSATITLAEGKNTVWVEVRMGSAKTQTETLQITYEPLKPDLYVLSIGTKSNLKYTEKDAREFAQIFSRQGGSADKLFHETFLETLSGTDATSDNLLDKVIALRARNIQPNDVVLVFISSHGFKHKDGFRIQGSNFKSTQVERTSVLYAEIEQQLAEINCKRFLFLDACQSGAFVDGDGSKKASPAVLYDEIQRLVHAKNGITTLASSRGDEYSWEDDAWQNGAFTKAIKEALQNGKADENKNGVITTNELFKYVGQRVNQLVEGLGKKDPFGNRATQKPQFQDQIGEVGIFVTD